MVLHYEPNITDAQLKKKIKKYETAPNPKEMNVHMRAFLAASSAS